MEEIKVKNEQGMKVLINGLPNLFNMPDEEFNLLISEIEMNMCEYFKKKKQHSTKNIPP